MYTFKIQNYFKLSRELRIIARRYITTIKQTILYIRSSLLIIPLRKTYEFLSVRLCKMLCLAPTRKDPIITSPHRRYFTLWSLLVPGFRLSSSA